MKSKFTRWAEENDPDEPGSDGGCFFVVLIGIIFLFALACKIMWDYFEP